METAADSVNDEPASGTAPSGYSFLGPAGTFTWEALAQVPEAAGKPWRATANVTEALDDVVSGRSEAAMIAIENSIDGGVSVAQDALATVPGLRIVGEYLVPVTFVLVGRPGTTMADVRVLNAHPVAYAQCHSWLDAHLPRHSHIPSSSNVAAADALLATDGSEPGAADAAIAPPGIVHDHDLAVLAENIGDNPNAVTRFALISRSRRIPDATGADKTSIIAELPREQAGTLLGLLEQFSTRGVNLSMIESRPIGDAMGRYRFVIDMDGHIHEERIADALLGLKRYSPKITFLGSYPRADRSPVVVDPRYRDHVFIEARDWLRGLLSGEPD